MNTPLIVVVGPTASGKSDFAMKIAQRYNGEIICADSRTVYKNMDIGTAKPSVADRELVKHHIIDICAPNQQFTAADFKHLANLAIKDIGQRHKLPIIVGGTGLYIDSVLYDYSFGPPADTAKRLELQSKTIQQLKDLCVQMGIDLPVNASNKRHLIRSIETGGVLNKQKQMRKDTIVVGITTNKELLLARITSRVYKMLDQGVLQEAVRLSEQYGWDIEPMKGNIYRALKPVVQGHKPLDEALPECVRLDMQLAKRQLTWFKRNKSIVWGSVDTLLSSVDMFVNGVKK